MDDKKLELFIANMRAAGHSDDVIARQLLDNGKREILVLNAFGISHLDELKEKIEPEEEFNSTTVIPSAIPIGMDFELPEELPEESPHETPKVARERHYPRPAPRKQTPEAQPLSQPDPNGEKYEHHTYEDFMHQTQDHKELEAGSNHSLPTGSALVDKKLENALHEEDVKELLHRQNEVVKDTPTEPQIADLLTDDVTKELEEIVMPNQGPRTKSLELEPTAQDVSGASNIKYVTHELKNNNLLLSFMIIVFVGILIGLAFVVATQILG